MQVKESMPLGRAETIQPTEDALSWVIRHNLVIKKTTKDPETFANIQGYILTEKIREKIGANILIIFAKAASKQNLATKGLTVQDTFITATVATLRAIGKVHIDEDRMVSCANVVLALLPFGRLEEAGIAQKTLRSLTHDRRLVNKIEKMFS